MAAARALPRRQPAARTPRPARTITEKQFMQQVMDLARYTGWTAYHTWNSQHSTAGFPDLCLVRPPRLIFAELKTERGRVRPEQVAWLELLGDCPLVEVALWRPSDIDRIAKALA